VATVKEEENDKASVEDQDAREELPTARAHNYEFETINAPVISKKKDGLVALVDQLDDQTQRNNATDNRFEVLLSDGQSQPQLEEVKQNSKLSSVNISSMHEVSGQDLEDEMHN